MPILIIIAIILGGGVSLSANSALPGDALYGFKIHVNENIESALSIIGARAKAEMAEKLALKRLDEAEKLSAEGKLTADAKTALATNFEEHADVVNSNVVALSDKGDVNDAENIETDFESKINTHTNALQNGGDAGAQFLVAISSAVGRTENAHNAIKSGVSQEASAKGEFGEGVDLSASSTNSVNANTPAKTKVNLGTSGQVDTHVNNAGVKTGGAVDIKLNGSGY